MKLLRFLKRNPVLCVAFLAAAATSFLVPPDAAWLDYFDWKTLACLFLTLAVVCALRDIKFFNILARRLVRLTESLRSLVLALVYITFLGSMLIANDMALITFLPLGYFALDVTGHKRHMAYVFILQNISANLGGMLTPFGNPQNLYLYSRYGLGAGEFFSITGPVWGLSLLLILLLCLGLPGTALRPALGKAPKTDRKKLALYLALFALCLSSVFRLLPWPLLLLGMGAALLVFDRRMLLAADFCLLLTFAAFFVFAGNLARLGAVEALLRRLLSGREYLTALVTSQVISNVPAALLLSGFTEEARELLLGVDVGGLGTPIASLASLISLKLYSRSPGARTGRFLGLFLGVNLLLLALLTAAHLLLGQVF